jgi:hypothetical protein
MSVQDSLRLTDAVIGGRIHSGWGALVAVAKKGGSIEVIARRHIVIATGTSGNQPYHFAKGLELQEAGQFLEKSFTASKLLAEAAVRDVLDELLEHQYHVVGAAVLLASGRTLPSLMKILASHPLIHTAEGEFFREAFSKACESLGLPVTGFRERNLDEVVQATFGKAATRVQRQISTLGHSLGPPWTRDQKMAALAALVVLANLLSPGKSNKIQ